MDESRPDLHPTIDMAYIVTTDLSPKKSLSAVKDIGRNRLIQQRRKKLGDGTVNSNVNVNGTNGNERPNASVMEMRNARNYNSIMSKTLKSK